MGSTWFSTLEAIRAGEPQWEAIACYREPVARYLRRAYPRLPGDVAQDVVQEVLCAMRTHVVSRFDPDRGRFRHFLGGVIKNEVRRAGARLRSAPPLEVEPPAPDDAAPLATVDLEARLVRAVRRAHDGWLDAGPTQHEVLYCFAGRLLEGLSYDALAAREGLSTSAVKRRLQTARQDVLRALVAGELEDAALALPSRALAALTKAVQEALAGGRPLSELLGRRWKHPEASAAAAALVADVRAGVAWFPGLDSPDGQAFVNALRSVLEGPGPEVQA
ncbi:MAG: sigma-70 family RNA polymerase sigma factor [Planctomycetes bacterium]|nr:sigma-70 family RNA polymerase sigma factor [Planctomycetota bacterium]